MKKLYIFLYIFILFSVNSQANTKCVALKNNPNISTVLIDLNTFRKINITTSQKENLSYLGYYYYDHSTVVYNRLVSQRTWGSSNQYFSLSYNIEIYDAIKNGCKIIQVSSDCTQSQYFDANNSTCVDNPICAGNQHIDTINHICVDNPPCTATQYADINQTCQDIPNPPNFPTDINSSHGAVSTGYAPIPQASCNSTASPDYQSAIGAYHIVGWDYGLQKCIATAFKCNSGFVYKVDGYNCVIPPDKLVAPTSSDPTSVDNKCVGNTWVNKTTWDFCSNTSTSLVVWLPPVGLENYGLEYGKKYVEYDCQTDYRLKKFAQVSCGDPLPKDITTKQLDTTSLHTTPTKETNVSALSLKDSTTAITDKLSIQNHKIDLLNNDKSTKSMQGSILTQLNKIGTNQLTSVGVSTALNSRDNNNKAKAEDNSSNGNGWGIAKNSIIGVYSKNYTPFNTTCGTPTFQGDITFMGTTISDPLKAFDTATKPYFGSIKTFMILTATLLGLLSVFRR